MKGKASWVTLGTQQTRHIIVIGEFASTVQRSHSPAQSVKQWFPQFFAVQEAGMDFDTGENMDFIARYE